MDSSCSSQTPHASPYPADGRILHSAMPVFSINTLSPLHRREINTLSHHTPVSPSPGDPRSALSPPPPTADVISNFCKLLASFCNHVQLSTQSLSESIQRRPSTSVSSLSLCPCPNLSPLLSQIGAVSSASHAPCYNFSEKSSRWSPTSMTLRSSSRLGSGSPTDQRYRLCLAFFSLFSICSQ